MTTHCHQCRPLLVVLALAGLAGPTLAMTGAEVAATRHAALAGSPAAQLLLGLAYLRGDQPAGGSAVEGIHWLERAALQGNAYAARRLGDLYAAGRLVPRNALLAADWHERAARRGEAAPGAPHTGDRPLTAEALEDLARDGDVEAQLRLAMDYRDGHRGLPRDGRAAIHWLRQAADAGNRPAMTSLAAVYDNGAVGIPADPRAAARWREQAAGESIPPITR